ncbi:hypothetical protein BJY04DRAFT_214798 [Aspergillus karnatakaensis]|uniref:uncharacterized protein n=1 Tax=Aspergillus karnatakaensis TaxID=1810916 RepID=UPI003CCCB5D0
MPTVPSRLERVSKPLGRLSQHRSIDRKLTELRPKGTLTVVARLSHGDIKRKQHAQAQKTQRDRMKSALQAMEDLLEGAEGAGGVQAGKGSGTKAELVEAAVEYIRTLQGQLDELRRGATRP